MSTSLNRNAPPAALRRNAQAIFRRTDPVRADQLAQRSAEAYGRALPSGKRAAAALGVSKSTVSDMKRRGVGAWGRALLELVQIARDPNSRPGALVTAAKITLIDCVMALSDHDLAARFWQLTLDEAAVEGRLNETQQMFTVTGDLSALAAAARAVADNATEMAAVAGELARRGVDLRTWGRA